MTNLSTAVPPGLAALLESHPRPMFVVGLDRTLLQVNDPLVELLGSTREEILAAPFGALLPAEERSAASAEFGFAKAGRARDTFSLRLDTASGAVDCEVTVFPVREADGRISVLAGVIDLVGPGGLDIRQLTIQEQVHLRIGTLLEKTLDQIAVGVLLLDPDQRCTFANDTAHQMLPVPEADVIGRTLVELFPEAAASEFGQTLCRALDEGTSFTARVFWSERDIWMQITLAVTEDGSAIWLRDVTTEEKAREEGEDVLRRLRRKAALLDAAPDACYVCELDGSISYWNHGAARIYGWERDEVEGRMAGEALHIDPVQFEAAIEAVNRDGYWAGQLEQRTRGGVTVIGECRWQLVDDHDGRAPFILCINQDVTEFSREQQKRFRAQRLESLGTLAGGIAHDLNNVFTPLLLASQLLLVGEEDRQRAELLHSVEEGVQRGADMIRQVVKFARGEEGQFHRLDLPPLFGQLETFCRETLPKSIRVAIDAPDSLWPVIGDGTQILQVLLNLVTNARDAMPEGGELTVRARNVAPLGSSPTDASPGVVVIDVEDSGTGMSAKTMARVFEPFFTTKDIAGGSGLGLSTSATIARNHGGELEVYSELGRGTRFQLRLPAAGPQADLRQPARVLDRPESRDGGGKLVLVVDDETFIRQVIVQALEGQGYRTVTASQGAEAIALLDRRDDIDLVVTDMMMPEVDGLALAAHLHDHRPQVPVIAASGLAANDAAVRRAHPGVHGFLPKPFTSADLLDAVHSAFATAPVPDGRG